MNKEQIVKEVNYAMALFISGKQEEGYNTLRDLSDQLTNEIIEEV